MLLTLKEIKTIFAPKTIINKRYRILFFMNEGGSSFLFCCFDNIKAKKVALKVFKYQKQREEKNLFFQNEFNVVTKLSHPNIIKFYDFFEYHDYWCITMELLIGVTLRAKINTRICFGYDEINLFMAQINSAVNYIHNRGIVHADLKPDNIFLTVLGEIKLFDFGSAFKLQKAMLFKKKVIAFQNRRNIIGTSNYCSPEMIQNYFLFKASDIYALGIIIYELLTGAPPFTGRSYKIIAYKHVSELPIKLNQIDSTIPIGWQGLVMKAIAKNPSYRFQSVLELNQALAKVMKHPDQQIVKCKQEKKYNLLWVIRKSQVTVIKVKDRFLYFPSPWSSRFLATINVLAGCMIIVFLVLTFFI